MAKSQNARLLKNPPVVDPGPDRPDPPVVPLPINPALGRLVRVPTGPDVRMGEVLTATDSRRWLVIGRDLTRGHPYVRLIAIPDGATADGYNRTWGPGAPS